MEYTSDVDVCVELIKYCTLNGPKNHQQYALKFIHLIMHVIFFFLFHLNNVYEAIYAV